jgi:ketosteroid isomerase-like protein
MNDIKAVRQAIDGIFSGELDPLLGLLADDVVLQVALGGDAEPCREEDGKEAVAEYFGMLAGMVAFWNLDYTVRGDQLVAWGRESYTVKPCELAVSNEFALVFDFDRDQITRLLVIEDLPSFFREEQCLAGCSSGARRYPPLSTLDLVEHLAVSGDSFPTPSEPGLVLK